MTYSLIAAWSWQTGVNGDGTISSDTYCHGCQTNSVTISFLSHIFFLVSVVCHFYFHFAPLYEETDFYLLAFPSCSIPFIIPLKYHLVPQDCLTP